MATGQLRYVIPLMRESESRHAVWSIGPTVHQQRQCNSSSSSKINTKLREPPRLRLRLCACDGLWAVAELCVSCVTVRLWPRVRLTLWSRISSLSLHFPCFMHILCSVAKSRTHTHINTHTSRCTLYADRLAIATTPSARLLLLPTYYLCFTTLCEFLQPNSLPCSVLCWLTGAAWLAKVVSGQMPVTANSFENYYTHICRYVYGLVRRVRNSEKGKHTISTITICGKLKLNFALNLDSDLGEKLFISLFVLYFFRHIHMLIYVCMGVCTSYQ